MKKLHLISIVGALAAGTAMPAMAQTACEGLPALTLEGSSIVSATAIAASDIMPAHCEIMAQIPPKSSDGWPINLRVVLPDEWNGNAIQFGGGGFNGVIPAQIGGRWQTGAAASAFPNKGYATFSGDSGHDVNNLPLGPDMDPRRASFALQKEAFERYARYSVNETYNAAIAIVEARYGKPADKRFFVGFSQGGKEAMVAAQDHPDDYDGILVGDPVSNLTGLKLAHLQSSIGFYKDGGAGWVSPELGALVTSEVYAQCDPQDGLVDNWIADFEGCQPDLTTLLCSDTNKDECLTEPQLAAIENVAKPVELDFELANGLTGHAGYPWGNVGWQGSFAGERSQPSKPAPNAGGNDSYVYGLGDGYLRFMIAQNPEFDTLSFSPNESDMRQRIVEVSQILDATNPDLSGLKARGGKMILYAGGTSEVPPAEVANYWKRVNEKLGKDEVDTFLRFYIFPSINHGGVGPEGMPNSSDLFSVLEAWVAGGDAPGILVNESKDGSVKRPLCLYPTWPQYQGGDENAAESFTCVE